MGEDDRAEAMARELMMMAMMMKVVMVVVVVVEESGGEEERRDETLKLEVGTVPSSTHRDRRRGREATMRHSVSAIGHSRFDIRYYNINSIN